MADTMRQDAPSTPLNSIARRPAKATIAPNPAVPVDPIEETALAISLVFDAIAAAGMSDKEAAYAMAMQPSELSRVRTGQARLRVDAIWRLPDRFWAEFSTRVGEAKGLSPASARRTNARRIAELVRLLIEECA